MLNIAEKDIHEKLEKINSGREIVQAYGLNKVIDLHLHSPGAAKEVFDSVRMEGNPMPLSDVMRIISGEILTKDTAHDFQHVMDVRHLYNTMETVYKQPLDKLTVKFIQVIHEELSSVWNTNIPGKFRKGEPTLGLIGDAVHTRPAPEMIAELLESAVTKYNEAEPGLERCIEFVLEFLTILPFADYNGRTSRVLMNIMLMTLGHLPISMPFELRSRYSTAIRAYIDSKSAMEFTDLVLDQLSGSYVGWLEYIAAHPAR